MSVITVFSGNFCKEDPVVLEVTSSTGYKLVTDKVLISDASRLSGMGEGKIERAFSATTSVFNKFTHEKERAIAYLRLALAETLSDDDLFIQGFAGQLIPKEVSHVLRVCLIADLKFRTKVAAEEQGLSEKDAVKLIHNEDNDRAAWVNALFGNKDPWAASLYDIVIPMDKKDVAEAAALIVKNLDSDVVKTTESSRKAVEDFILAANTEVALVKEGHTAGVNVKDGSVTLTINKHVLMLSRLEEELKSIVSRVPGVKSVDTKVGRGFHKADVYRKVDLEAPSKVLLVDDEREFVQTLSERLIMREMGSAVTYDGESALKLVSKDEPEVMILDLKMPGIDGIEVLRRVKETRPEIEVIILTGHGSEADRKVCMDLGAFAYLHKPVDIDLLSESLKKANEKIRQKKAAMS
ncbi:MAG: response regulator [Deltaproteobacteria bacterium]|nr:response regulator [Deltaproteobacteria bacterium]MDL1960648.1 response regulator [Deltaproteobacteria bacterium]